jgi:integrase
MQRGNIKKSGGIWLLRYYEPVLVNGKVVKRAKAKKLADVNDQYRTANDVQPLADLILAPINAKTAKPESSQPVKDFLEHVYLAHVRESKKPSTQKAYLDFFRLVEPHVKGLEMRAVRTSDVDRILKAVADSKPRAHTTLRNVKSFLSGAFRYAKRTDTINENPVRDSVVPRGKSRGTTPAYTLEEIQALLTVIPEPAKTAVLVAALTGLRLSEIKGLRWEDVSANELSINRSVWAGHVTDTKTLASRAPVPLLPLVKKALEAHRKVTTGDGFIFHGNTGKPLRLENIVRRDVKPALEKEGIAWNGWHAFRRGVGTNLHALGADDKTISDILRHGNVAVTQAFYMKPVAERSRKAMQKMERAFRKAKG